MSGGNDPLVAVSLDVRAIAAAPDEIGRVAAKLDEAEVDLLILGGAAPGLDPLVLAAWLAMRVKRAGLVSTVPALNTAPFHAARALSALDVLTRGRSGWAPTSLGPSDQVGDEAVAKAVDFIDATCALWDSWDADALVIDKASGVYLDPARVRRVDYRGPVFHVMGPLNARRPLQGHPVLVQSDADPLWLRTAGRADVILVGAVDACVLAERRETVAEAGGRARLLATVRADDDGRLAIEALDRVAPLLDEGLIDGVHLLASDAASVDAVAEVLTPELRRRGRRFPPSRTGSLRASLGLSDYPDAEPGRRVSPAAA